MHDKENIIRTDRLIEATRKNLTGLEGKIGQILKYMGESVITQASDFYESSDAVGTHIYDQPENEDDLPTQDMDTLSRELGRILSTLQWGINMELSYLKECQIPIKRSELYTQWVEAEKVLTVTYKGYVVYREIEGELESYLPDPEWESAIDRIYESCKKIKKDSKPERDAEKTERTQQERLGFIAKLREKWGI
jgi:hypothetical protein